ncbi:hypothetical protein HPB50_009690 [Hyalomma asiaticum]|uniref:Uncharacterized protein n=1 Tax=Hyalomma asiaticum TaxID=266040 RepID=A0ACB7STF6_HYAAI|nr:hypothetical protein HPB50_009690 [Hyalomma asiaticum]
MDDCEMACDRVAVLSKGEILAVGTVPELKEMMARGYTIQFVLHRLSGEDAEVFKNYVDLVFSDLKLRDVCQVPPTNVETTPAITTDRRQQQQQPPQPSKRVPDAAVRKPHRALEAPFVVVNGTDTTADRICLVLHSMGEQARRGLMQQLTRATYAAPRSREEDEFAGQIQEQWDAFVAKVKQVARSTWENLAKRMASSLEQLATR